jgi:hypothetical protein
VEKETRNLYVKVTLRSYSDICDKTTSGVFKEKKVEGKVA